MRIATFMVVGPGEAGRYLEQVLSQTVWVDSIAVCLNRAGPEEERLVRRFSSFVVKDDREWGKNQWRIKQDFLKQVLEHEKPDWIWCLDADEIYPNFNREVAEQLASGKDIAWQFWCLQLWNDPEHVRLDLSFPNVRFYKVVPELGLHFHPTPLHCGLAPLYAYQWASQSSQHFLHYGLMSHADRQRKIERYDKYDPQAKYKARAWYQGLRNENITPVGVAEAMARLPETIFRRNPIKPHMSKDNTIFMFRNKHGKVVPAVGIKQKEQFTKMGFHELADITVNPHPEAPVPEVDVLVVEPVKEIEFTAAPAAKVKRGRPKKNGPSDVE